MHNEKAPEAFRTISEVAGDLDVPKHVLRFWEGKFSQLKPMKRGGGRRYYRPEDVALLKGIRRLLYSEGYTIRGVQKILRESGARSVMALNSDDANIIPQQKTVNSIPDVAAEAARSRLAQVQRPADFGDKEGVALLTAVLEELSACQRILAEAKK
jgi:DNA-binding transcriptional MerR regulator